MTFDIDTARTALEQEELGPVTREASNVSGSPYDYLYVWLEGEGDYEAPHIIVSDAREFEPRDGFLVGGYPFADADVDVELLDTLAEALAEVRALAAVDCLAGRR